MEKIITTLSEYSLETHKRVLGVNTDKDGNEFQYQPERSKREDLPKWASRAIMMPDGLLHFEDGTIIDSKQPIDEGCGALNS